MLPQGLRGGYRRGSSKIPVAVIQLQNDPRAPGPKGTGVQNVAEITTWGAAGGRPRSEAAWSTWPPTEIRSAPRLSSSEDLRRAEASSYESVSCSPSQSTRSPRTPAQSMSTSPVSPVERLARHQLSGAATSKRWFPQGCSRLSPSRRRAPSPVPGRSRAPNRFPGSRPTSRNDRRPRRFAPGRSRNRCQ